MDQIFSFDAYTGPERRQPGRPLLHFQIPGPPYPNPMGDIEHQTKPHDRSTKAH